MSDSKKTCHLLSGHTLAAICSALAFTGFNCDSPGANGGAGQDGANVACCLPDGCQVMSVVECGEASGGIVDGEESCDGDPCNKGACCSNGGCVLSTTEACDTNYQGDGTTCNAGLCLEGACCFEEDFGLGLCLDEKRDGCEALSGTWLGFDTKCEPAKPCGGEPDMGACCSTDGACELTDVATCALSDRSYAGDGVDCVFGLCSSGACCRADGCLDTARFGCVDDFNGEGTRCDTVNCAAELGACCYDSGMCIDIEDEFCASGFDGVYLGDGTTCSPNDPCDEPLGACCVDGVCQQLRETSCAATQGEYHGDDANCTDDPDICDQVLFSITAIDYSTTVQANTDGGTMTITWDGVLNFPVEVRHRLLEGTPCPASSCGAFIETFAEPANPLILKSTPACTNGGDTSNLPLLFPYEVVIVDSVNRESAPMAASWTCDLPP